MLITPLGLVFAASACHGGVLGYRGPAGLGVRWVLPAWPGRLTGRLQRLGACGACLLVWGRRYNHYRMDEMIGYSPACAGPTAGICTNLHGVAVYPCLRGANYFAVWVEGLGRGISLLARGQRAFHNARSFSARYIPACAGQTSMVSTRHWRSPVYPCLRRANLQVGICTNLRPGISLLARGQLFPVREAGQAARYIPAYAGPTRPARHQLLRPEVYPCLRGVDRWGGYVST